MWLGPGFRKKRNLREVQREKKLTNAKDGLERREISGKEGT